MVQKLLLIAPVTVALLLAGCSNEDMMEVITQNQPYAVTWEIEGTKTAGEQSTIRIRTYRNGALTDVYQEGRMIHVILSSAGYKDFVHSFSMEQETPGVYTYRHTFKEPGAYRFWIELDNAQSKLRHGPNADFIAFADLLVSGALPTEQITGPSRDFTQEKGGYALNLVPSHAPAGHESLLHMEVRDRGGMPVSFGHGIDPAFYVIIGPGLRLIAHGHAHDVHDQDIHFLETLPVPGDYLLWTELHPMRGDSFDTVEATFLVQAP